MRCRREGLPCGLTTPSCPFLDVMSWLTIMPSRYSPEVLTFNMVEPARIRVGSNHKDDSQPLEGQDSLGVLSWPNYWPRPSSQPPLNRTWDSDSDRQFASEFEVTFDGIADTFVRSSCESQNAVLLNCNRRSVCSCPLTGQNLTRFTDLKISITNTEIQKWVPSVRISPIMAFKPPVSWAD
jgi:hypothetical protein